MHRLFARIMMTIRWPNLVIIAVVQVLVYAQIIRPEATREMDSTAFLLVLATLMIAAGGFVINDIYDVDIDRINRPGKWQQRLASREAWILYTMLVTSGGMIALWIASRHAWMSWLWVYPLVVLGLWGYSAMLKCTPLLGNLWVGAFSGGSILAMALPEVLSGHPPDSFSAVWPYAGFAFLTNFFREVVKDLEDHPGDAAAGCNTLPVRFGVSAGRRIALGIGGLLIVGLAMWGVVLGQRELWIFSLVLPGLAVWTTYLLVIAHEVKDYAAVSLRIKLIMLAGTLVLFWL